MPEHFLVTPNLPQNARHERAVTLLFACTTRTVVHKQGPPKRGLFAAGMVDFEGGDAF